MVDHVGGAKARPGKHEFPVDADAFGLVGIADAQRAGRLHDQAHMALRGQQFAQRVPVAVGVGQVHRRVHAGKAQRLQLRCQWLAVVDDVVGAHPPAPGLGLRPRSGGDHGEACMPGQLNRHRTDPAGAADHQQAARVAFGVQMEGHALEQQFPGGDRGQRQGCRLGEVQGGRLGADQALVDQVVLGVAAGAGGVAGVIDLVPGLEQFHLIAHRLDHAGSIEAQHPRLIQQRRRTGPGAAQLGVHRIDRGRLDPYQQVARTGLGARQGDILQGLGIIDGQMAAEGDGFHQGTGHAVILVGAGPSMPVGSGVGWMAGDPGGVGAGWTPALGT